MATEAKPKLLTAEEFMEMDLGEGMHELVQGEIIEVPPRWSRTRSRLCQHDLRPRVVREANGPRLRLEQ